MTPLPYRNRYFAIVPTTQVVLLTSLRGIIAIKYDESFVILTESDERTTLRLWTMN